ncbi:hypothetical protein, partial [Flammeovirga agarivorans]
PTSANLHPSVDTPSGRSLAITLQVIAIESRLILMRLLITLILILIGIKAFSQEELKPTFKNQGEQEKYWAQEFFKYNYRDSIFSTYKGEVRKISNYEYRFNNKSFFIESTSDSFQPLFSQGILYPQLIIGYHLEPKKSTEELELLSPFDRYIYTLKRGDSLTVFKLEEIKFLSKSAKVKRFWFWLFDKDIPNPTVYLFELTNTKANNRTSMEDFILNSKLTFFKKGWMVL